VEKMFHPGRRIWVIVAFENLAPFVTGPYTVVFFQKFLPAGRYTIDDHLIERKRSLIKVYTDPGGTRTLAAADIRFRDPGRIGR
jgi:hypothetical protein